MTTIGMACSATTKGESSRSSTRSLPMPYPSGMPIPSEYNKPVPVIRSVSSAPVSSWLLFSSSARQTLPGLGKNRVDSGTSRFQVIKSAFTTIKIPSISQGKRTALGVGSTKVLSPSPSLERSSASKGSVKLVMRPCPRVSSIVSIMPSFRTTTRSAKYTASRMLWVTKTIVLPVLR